jgi:hypothetical protein
MDSGKERHAEKCFRTSFPLTFAVYDRTSKLRQLQSVRAIGVDQSKQSARG